MLVVVGAEGLGIPHDGVGLAARTADQVATVGAEAGVALAEGSGGARGGARGRGGLGAGAVGFEVAFEGVEEDVALWGRGGEEEGFSVVGEFEFGPCWGGGGGGGGVDAAEIEGGEGGFVVVPEVVEED